MPLNIAKSILNEAFKSTQQGDLLTIDFFGGEPFLEFEKIKMIVEYVKASAKENRLKSSYRFFATTNGTLIHGAVQDWLRNNPNFHVGLSLDGNEYMQNINRSNSFDQIDLDFFSSMYPKQPIKMTISDKTLSHLAEGVIFCHSKGFEVSCNLAYGINWADSCYTGQLEKQLDVLTSFYLKHPDIKPCSLLNRKLAVIGAKKDKPTIQRWCGAGTAMHTYDCDGTYYPCQFFMPISCGEEKSKMSKTIQFHKEVPTSLLEEKCRQCLVKDACPTCYGFNYCESGNIYKKNDAQCILEKRTFYANACFFIQRWDANQLPGMPENELLASLIGAKSIIEQFA